ncbi:MAG: PD40 domain-containing protein [Bacteroidales bacterium]|nr:PD40 domain-containing protein [Bacteroidales bacterium]
MRYICYLIISLVFSCNLFAQEKTLSDYDKCKDEVSKSLIKKYEKAVDYYKDRKYNQASLLLHEIIKEDENYASPYFLMGLIGVVKENGKMIEKYFPLVKENCPEFSHPYLYYYMGMIDYTEERYESAVKNFETFLSVTDGNNAYDSLQNIAINYIDWSDFLHKTMEQKVAFNPQKINFLPKNKNYYEPFISWDKQQIYFIREEVVRDTNYDSFTSEISTSSTRYLELSELDSTGFYDKGFILDDPFNNSFPQGGVSVTADNNYIFFSKQTTANGNKSWDVYRCERIGEYFTQAKSININTDNYDEFSPSVSADGNYLYFVSNRPGGKGGYDIWCSKRTDRDTWSEPENLGRNVNTFADETYPFIAADNEKLYFLSNGRKTLGGSDIFVYDLAAGKPAENIGYPINTEANEHAMGLMADGQTAYSTFKNADNKFYEINLFTLDSKYQAQKRVFVSGKTEKELAGDIYLKILSVGSGKYTSYYIADEHPDFTLVIDPNEEYILFLEQKGYMFYAERFDSRTANLSVKQTPLESGNRINLNGIGFDKTAGGFDGNSQAVLDAFVSFLKLNQRIRITITANEEMNSALKNYLIKSGIREDRLSFKQKTTNLIIYQID